MSKWSTANCSKSPTTHHDDRNRRVQATKNTKKNITKTKDR